MIALVITGLALTLIFSIGNRASSSGFSLGRRVLSLSDQQIEALTFRALIEGLVVPNGLQSRGAGMGLRETGPENLMGSSLELTGSAVLGRDTVCADAGPVGRMTLKIEQVGRNWQLVCQMPSGAATPVMDFGPRPVRFSYSKDGQVWTDTVLVRPGLEPNEDYTNRFKARIVYVRLASPDLAALYIERATTGRPRPGPISAENM
jgi:hypothetical protein